MNSTRRSRLRRWVLLLALVLALGSCGGSPDRGRPNVLLYVVDTLRADALGAYGNESARTPHVDGLAARGTLFERAHANSSWTRPGVASLLTGLYPPRHGAQRREHRLGAQIPTLGVFLREHGYHTLLVSTNPNVGRAFGFEPGFDQCIELYARREAGAVLPEELTVNSRAAGARLTQALDGISGPWCAVVLTIDPHAPHHPPPRFAPPPPRGPARGMDGRIATLRQDGLNDAQKAYARELYAGEVTFNDASFGTLLEGLEGRGELENTLILFASDHGEEFWEHGERRGHGESLTEEVTRVPLVIAGPGVERRARIATPVEQVDVVPTVLSLVGFTPPRGLDGCALLGPGSQDLAPRPLYSVLDLGEHRLRAVTEAHWKLVRDGTRGEELLYDLREGEGRALDETATPEAQAARARLRTYLDALEALDGAPADLAGELPPELEEALRALGYAK